MILINQCRIHDFRLRDFPLQFSVEFLFISFPFQFWNPHWSGWELSVTSNWFGGSISSTSMPELCKLKTNQG